MNVHQQKKYIGLGICIAMSAASILIEKEYFGALEWLIENDRYDTLYLLALVQLGVSIWVIKLPPKRLLVSACVVALFLVGQAPVLESAITFVLMAFAASQGTFAP